MNAKPHQLNKKSGFTIIEVLIVLAIAGLILLVVFLAVPALQRSQRNSARKSDASRVSASVVEYTSNDAAGNLPTSAAQCTSIKNAAATLSQYSSLAANCILSAGALPAAPTTNTLYLATSPPTTNNWTVTPNTNTMVLATYASCATGANVPGVTSTGTTKSAALLYTIESGATWSWVCVNPQ